MAHYLWTGLVTLLMATATGNPKLAQDEPDTAVIYVRVLALPGQNTVIADMTPAPEAVLAAHALGYKVEVGSVLECHVLHGILQCNDAIFEFAGCYAPEPVAQPPVVVASLRR